MLKNVSSISIHLTVTKAQVPLFLNYRAANDRAPEKYCSPKTFPPPSIESTTATVKGL